MATTRTATKKPAARKPAARKPDAPKTKPVAHELHGAAGFLDRMLRFTEHAALRVAVMAKRGRRSLLQHA